jgi:hypothetical protein
MSRDEEFGEVELAVVNIVSQKTYSPSPYVE